MSPLAPFACLFGLVVALRAVEMQASMRHAGRLRAAGAREVGASHYPWLIASHLLYYAMLMVEVLVARRQLDRVSFVALGLMVPVLGLRFWTLRTLGERWSTRVYVIPGERVVTRGPYRYLKHPNYVVVFCELTLLALGFRAWLTLAVNLPLQIVILRRRIRYEEEALASDTDWQQALGDKPRFLPRP